MTQQQHRQAVDALSANVLGLHLVGVAVALLSNAVRSMIDVSGAVSPPGINADLERVDQIVALLR